MASGTYIRTRAACARRASIALDRSRRIWTAKRVEAPRSRPGDNEVEEDEAIEDRGVAAIVDREEILRRMRDPVRDRHRARGDERRRARKQAERAQQAGRALDDARIGRSEESRVGQESVRTLRSRWQPYH